MANPKEDFEIMVNHFGISVPDMESSIKWYHDMLDFEVAKREGMSPDFQICFMRRGNFYVELFQIKNAAPLPPGRSVPNEDLKTHGMKHIAFTVKGLPQVLEILKARGVQMAKTAPPAGAAAGGPPPNRGDHKPAAFINDNAGNIIELMEWGAP
jgi:methylmalonyl-CoA/ethylmalonyl-CoA epimerase